MSTYDLSIHKRLKQGIEAWKTAVVANLSAADKFTVSEIANLQSFRKISSAKSALN